MVKEAVSFAEQLVKPLTPQEQIGRNRAVENLIREGKRKRFYILHKTPGVISIGLRGKKNGTWLFDANSQLEIRRLAAEGEEITENAQDLILEGETATTEEVKQKIPEFIRKYYPPLARTIKNGVKVDDGWQTGNSQK